jgi:hypothetical protein
MQTLQADYFAAYRSIKLTRDANGVLVVEVHNNGSRSFSRHKIIRSLSTPFTGLRKIEQTKS